MTSKIFVPLPHFLTIFNCVIFYCVHLDTGKNRVQHNYHENSSQSIIVSGVNQGPDKNARLTLPR